MKYREWVFLCAAVILAYAVFFFSAPLVSGVVNDTFYNGQPLYRLTWSHYSLPLAGAVATFLVIVWLREEFDWPKDVKDYVIFLAGAAISLFIAFVIGVRAYAYTFVLYGAGTMSLAQLWNFFLFTPFWALAPGVFAGWLGAFLTYYKQ